MLHDGLTMIYSNRRIYTAGYQLGEVKHLSYDLTLWDLLTSGRVGAGCDWGVGGGVRI